MIANSIPARLVATRMRMPMATPYARAQGPTMHMRMDITCTEQSYDRGAPNHPGKP